MATLQALRVPAATPELPVQPPDAAMVIAAGAGAENVGMQAVQMMVCRAVSLQPLYQRLQQMQYAVGPAGPLATMMLLQGV